MHWSCISHLVSRNEVCQWGGRLARTDRRRVSTLPFRSSRWWVCHCSSYCSLLLWEVAQHRQLQCWGCTTGPWTRVPNTCVDRELWTMSRIRGSLQCVVIPNTPDSSVCIMLWTWTCYDPRSKLLGLTRPMWLSYGFKYWPPSFLLFMQFQGPGVLVLEGGG